MCNKDIWYLKYGLNVISITFNFSNSIVFLICLLVSLLIFFCVHSKIQIVLTFVRLWFYVAHHFDKLLVSWDAILGCKGISDRNCRHNFVFVWRWNIFIVAFFRATIKIHQMMDISIWCAPLLSVSLIDYQSFKSI